MQTMGPSAFCASPAHGPHGLAGVVAQEVDRLAHLGDRVRVGFPGLAHDEADENVDVVLERIGGASQRRGARPRRRASPAPRRLLGGGDGHPNFVRVGMPRHPHNVAPVRRIEHRFAGRSAAGRIGRPGPPAAQFETGEKRGEPIFVRKIEPARVRTLRPVEIAGSADFLVRSAWRLDRARDRNRIEDEFVDSDVLVGDAIDEGRVRAVLEQAAHEIGEQRLVRTDRRVDATRPIELVAPDDLLVERFAHAMQALKLVLAAIVIGSGHRQNGGERLGVMGGELRKDGVRRDEQFARAGEVGDVGVDLAGKDGKPLEAIDLRPLDLRIPVGPFDEPDHQPSARPPGEINQPIDDERATFAIGLNDEAEAVPLLEIVIEAQRLEEVERNLEAVGLLRVDIQSDVVASRQRGEAFHAREEFAHHAGALQAGIAGMEGGELDRDARPLVDASFRGRFADGVDRVFIVGVVALGVIRRRRRFAEHVVGIGESFRLRLAAGGERLLNRPPLDELLAHEAHRDVDALANDRFAAARDEARQRSGKALLARRRDQPAGEHKPPGRRIDEKRGTLADVGSPVAWRQLVANQRVAGGDVGDAQQGLGEAHQRHAFLARQRIFVNEPLDAARARLAAQPRDEAARERLHLRANPRRPSLARSIRAGRHSVSGRRYAAVIAWRSALRGRSSARSASAGSDMRIAPRRAAPQRAPPVQILLATMVGQESPTRLETPRGQNPRF